MNEGGDPVGLEDRGERGREPIEERGGWSQRYQHWQQRRFVDEQGDVRLPEHHGGVPVTQGSARRRDNVRRRPANPIEELPGCVDDNHGQSVA